MLRRPAPRGFTLAEVVVSVTVVSLAVVAGLTTFGAFARGAAADRETAVATELAAQLAAEIRAQAFEEPVGTAGFGPEPGEADGTRCYFDDVDDFDGWTASPPMQRDGTVMTDYADYSQEVAVQGWSPYTVADFKTIRVTVKKNGRVRAEIVLLRSRNNAY